jgi:hypothetical protein
MLSGSVVVSIFVGFYYYYFSLVQTKYSKLFSFIYLNPAFRISTC